MTTERSAAAAALRALHVPGDPLVLPNAWDVPSALAVERAGFGAVATASAAVSATLGHPDGEAMPVDEAFAAITRIASAVAVPVTADVEHGYGLGPAELAARLARAGAVGCNVEDSLHERDLLDPHEHAAYLRELRAADPDLVINARTDVFLLGGDLAEALRRARLYAEAGADCVYPIGLADEAAIEEFTASAGLPVNVLRSPASPPAPRLAELGVARISHGPFVHREVLAAHADLLARLRAER
ncbi:MULTISPECIES: isocitrate lyase/phosphoenolpyruvate mutase family protein [Actinosynnema]|uniref:isocitrate lyase/PEP mutase family protein n=1 Tax=Actinosynnema TaxID=40566 RepID=UPI0020A5F016|nr:isocitrate lyase/phosphoenolpyruvate mutase family protein [Actinosynnema pretiosum]MCP2096255.1 2-Methylisocitrate lyase, PEP mutase family [Actinosynnema pretiosum]